jgi:hypothetical protein
MVLVMPLPIRYGLPIYAPRKRLQGSQFLNTWFMDSRSRIERAPFDTFGSPSWKLFNPSAASHDSLATFEYRDPRMLIELVDRRMVQDISKYLDCYTRSRPEPPSFIVTPEELQSHVHLPAGETDVPLLVGRGTSTGGSP